MFLRSIALVLALLASLLPLTRPVQAQAKDELLIGITQYPSTWNPLIGAMLAKSLIQNMTARPFTAYDPDWKLVCLLCTELPTLENGKARVVDLPDGKKGMEIDFTIRPDAKWGDGTSVTVKDVEFTIEFGKHPQSGVASSESYRRVLKVAARDDKSFTMTLDRVTFDYNSSGLLLLPAVAASFWARQVVTMALVALPMAAMSGLVGLLISYHTSVPSGPAIVLVASLFYIVSLLLGTNDSVRMRLAPPAHLRA